MKKKIKFKKPFAPAPFESRIRLTRTLRRQFTQQTPPIAFPVPSQPTAPRIAIPTRRTRIGPSVRPQGTWSRKSSRNDTGRNVAGTQMTRCAGTCESAGRRTRQHRALVRRRAVVVAESGFADDSHETRCDNNGQLYGSDDDDDVDEIVREDAQMDRIRDHAFGAHARRANRSQPATGKDGGNRR